MRSILLENARDIHSEPSKYKDSHKKIKDAVYLVRIICSEEEFLRLVWMDSEGILGSDLYNQLTPRIEPRTLKNLVKRITENYSGSSPHEILEALHCKLSQVQHVEQYVEGTNTSMNNTWFEGCVAMNGTFDPRLIRELWVRNLNQYELKQSQNGIYYIEDGSHRALVYALNLHFNKVEYIPITVRWCKSWRHIFPWAQEQE